ncbi:hypothetical protein Cgig2_005134 [Carnegiea gigantea]|uniref:Uncharacterized protein n=1 Tax=Carnegiea gigantea TaxID=171969 RepID=A0A9Q1KG14_9CARY|nr:hypothetical protein Cgig2_005134 [Carnegiea gigantea]
MVIGEGAPGFLRNYAYVFHTDDIRWDDAPLCDSLLISAFPGIKIEPPQQRPDTAFFALNNCAAFFLSSRCASLQDSSSITDFTSSNACAWYFIILSASSTVWSGTVILNSKPQAVSLLEITSVTSNSDTVVAMVPTLRLIPRSSFFELVCGLEDDVDFEQQVNTEERHGIVLLETSEANAIAKREL